MAELTRRKKVSQWRPLSATFGGGRPTVGAAAPRRRSTAARSLARSVGRSVGRLDRQRTTSHLRRPSNHETSYRVWHALRDAPLPPTPTPTPMAIRNNGSCPTWRSLRCRRFFGHSLAVAVGFFLEALSLSHSLFLCSFFLFIRVGYYRDDHCLRRCRDVSRGSNRRLSADGRADLNNRMTSAVIPRAINKKKKESKQKGGKGARSSFFSALGVRYCWIRWILER